MLLVIYLMIFTASVLHVHDYGQEAMVCDDCLAHVQHDGHLSQGSLMDADCVLCNFFHTSYLTPQVLTVSAIALVPVLFAMQPTLDVVCREVTLPSLRAPPAYN